MQFSENWLRSLVDTDLDSEALSHALTMAGLEVEEMQPVAASFSKVVVAKILSAEKHPDADRLQVCKVDVGLAEPLQIVCGAANARAGLLAPCAMVGAELPGFSIKQAKVRGVESFGMMCSSKELGLTADATGLLELESDAVVGQDIREHLDLNDHLFTLKLTPNRSDCLSITGIARDVAAITGAATRFEAIQPANVALQQTKNVEIAETEACPRYAGRLVTGINAKAPTPAWMVKRLERSGLRSISAVVDITNYVLLALGQPMHAFDAAKLNGNINVRFAKAGESIALLNDTTIELKADDLVIADAQGAVALAGIMGGKASSVSDETTEVFLESAFFVPSVIAGKARRLGLSTDSSYRFERGVDFGGTRDALEYATALLLQICGGKAGVITEVVANLPVRHAVKLRMRRLVSVLGIPFEQQAVAKLLNQLGFSYMEADEEFKVTPPSYRFDINIEEDLIEEIARLHGYDHIPAIAPVAALTMLSAPESKVALNKLRDTMVANGYQEVVTYSFVDESWERDLLGNVSPIKLMNPIASNLSVMRTSLWGGLLDSLNYNLNRKQERAFLFEIGAVFHQVAGAYQETTRISGLVYGSAKPEQWAASNTDIDFFDVKAHVNALLGAECSYEKAEHTALHPGQSARILLNGKAVGWLGKLHPKWLQHYSLSKSTFLFEIDADLILNREVPVYTEVSKLLPLRRDIAIVIDENIAVEAVLTAIKTANIPLLQNVALFDLYQGKGIAENKKSLALSVLMHDTQKTLTDNDADILVTNLLQLLENKFGATLRN
ncbi:MAG: phenylalanine--tRNA ligase subunit beta [Methylotenera sp. 24-45-7]|jgi:phenylalanyl-tRNA synthetase beta chain|nr:MAG: phenylalanine--tRNA ligase subunit beta [Methylotenera sp. 24-45-7]OZA54467.1 MAG: phenylalanine--tRNA ligase subunit beta [Methylophilales bacterium 39-45-7]HQS36782.1 phenylalanine--tRNA ligase subunit beta [Methylotenera sp.]HQS42933.1 phenylalanine--tRNA ligase subunit beta [Methylotenera sp.]